MNRRRFLKCAGAASALASLPLSSLSVWGMQPSFSGDFLLYVQVGGGWDVTSFCDPKINVKGEKIINNWAEQAAVQRAGNLFYAPVAENARFFSDHYQKMLVINGINTRTNAHDLGSQLAHTGSLNRGLPHLAALYAYEKGQGMAMPVMSSSRFTSGGLLPPTALGAGALTLIDPNRWRTTAEHRYLPSDDLAAVHALRRYQAEQLTARTHLPPKQKQQIDNYFHAVSANTRGFEDFRETYNALDSAAYPSDRFTDSIKFAFTAFKAGLGIAADIRLGGFDTHDNHDQGFGRSMATLTNALAAAWHYAEQLAIADRLIVVLSSEFGRTPWYNNQQGKDHWPYNSAIVMKKGVSWTNRMVGLTDSAHIGQRLNPQTLKSDRQRGLEIEPKHVMHALRELLGVAHSDAASYFNLEVEQPFQFFNS